ncbi:MAG: 4-phosphopantetheinyl transferase [Chitinophagaceae bacterium]|nr:4-phosphopantetheinyl transferase [Chitinophagaceae bacterium]
MPVFFQHQINESTRLGIWKIEETEEFFKNNVPQHRDVTHPRKRLQHLAGRFLLQFLAPDFPYELIQIAETRKPFLSNEKYHFSISHCGDYAAAIISKNRRVGIDIEISKQKIGRISEKFLSREEHAIFNIQHSAPDPPFPAPDYLKLTLLWSAKEAVFKWYGEGGVDFREDIHLLKQHEGPGTVDCFFSKTTTNLTIHHRYFESLVLDWVLS